MVVPATGDAEGGVVQDAFRKLTDEQLRAAYEEYKQWEVTGCLENGIVRRLDRSVTTRHEIQIIQLPLYEEMARRFYERG